MKCNNCSHYHAATEPHVCTLLNCKCDENTFEPYQERRSFQYYTSVIEQFETLYDKIKYLLEEIPELRNYGNKDFVFAYWHYNNNFCPGMKLEIPVYKELNDPESIRRCKQKVVENNPHLKSTDESLNNAKSTKKIAIEEWVTQ
jgi:hypothetical protein